MYLKNKDYYKNQIIIAKRQQAKQENQEEPIATIAVTDGDTTTPSEAISVNGDL